jgi:dTDP-4-amino-4,6-dideoxygalactose transaminase
MIKLADPDLGKEELKEVKEVFKSGWLVQGDKVEEFEKKVENYLGINNAIAVSNGTTALHISLVVNNIKEGDKVIVPAVSFPATVNVVEHVGATPIFVDVEKETYNIDPVKLNNKLKNIEDKNSIKAIIPVHLFGQSADMDPIVKVAKKYNLKIIEDAACALGAKYNNEFCGKIGDIGCFSFHPRKAITTGEGGMIVTKDDDIAEQLRILRNHGITKVNGDYDFVLPGYNYRLTNIQGAIGSVQMDKLEKIINKRRELAKQYDNLLKKNKKNSAPVEMKNNYHIYQSYVVFLDNEFDRDKIINKLKKSGVESTIGTYALHMLDYYKKKYYYKENDFEIAKNVYNQAISLPLHHKMNKEDVSYVVDTFKKIIEI